MGELLQRNATLTDINLGANRICCSEFEPFGLYLMRLLSANNAVTVRLPTRKFDGCLAHWLTLARTHCPNVGGTPNSSVCYADLGLLEYLAFANQGASNTHCRPQNIIPLALLMVTSGEVTVITKCCPRDRRNTDKSCVPGRQVFNVDGNDVTPKMMNIIAEKVAANRAVRRDTTFVDCLRLKYPRISANPVVADPR